ncbi:MAG: beta-N-acetylhexosaminidase [Ignavibacteriaceae bacterium]
MLKITKPNTPILLILFIFLFQSCTFIIYAGTPEATDRINNLIPKPLFAETTGGAFTLKEGMKIQAGQTARDVGQYLADKLNASTGFNITVTPEEGDIVLRLDEKDVALGEEGYALKITQNKVELSAYKTPGLFYGIQTIRQLLPPEIESSSVRNIKWEIPTGVVRDRPRFQWRGAMLDVARHFFSTDDVKKYIDLLAQYKFNRFHLHLSDDQGWRIEIKSWPKLTEIGGSGSVNNEKPGFYTQEEFSGIIKYAAERFITVIPEIDMPGHTHAALVSYPELNCDDSIRTPYTGIAVGFSSLCIDKDITYQFVKDVVREISALLPGEYFHVGGDEASSTDLSDYIRFIDSVQNIVNSNGKKMVGWEEIIQTDLKKSSVAQLWRGKAGREAADKGAKVILSPAPKIYIDMKYDSTTVLGLNWAAYIEVNDAYDWKPEEYIQGVTEYDILGIEAPLWSETLTTFDHIEFLAFPRILGVAEIAWSQKHARNWNEYKLRLGNHGTRLNIMQIDFYKSPFVEWND